MKLTPGKLAGLKAVSDKRGVIAAAAMDQRGSLQKSLAKEKGGEVTDAMMEEFKSLVTEVLTPHASAILLDPEWGLPASKRRAKNAGLLLAYEKTGYDKTGPGRLGDLLDHWSVRRLKEAGADCVKILLYYTPDDPKDVNDKKHAWVERIGDECRANDIPYFLEFVGYEEGADEKGVEYAKKKPHIVTESMREFSKDRYGVDVLKVEVPVNMKFVEGAKSFGGQKAYTKQEAIDLFHKAAASVATKPFIYLSAGVSNAEFSETLELAGESGVKFNGVLCGRATWKEGIPVYAKQGAAAFRKWLETEGVKNIDNVNDKLKAATSWHSYLRRGLSARVNREGLLWSAGESPALFFSVNSACHRDVAQQRLPRQTPLQNPLSLRRLTLPQLPQRNHPQRRQIREQQRRDRRRAKHQVGQTMHRRSPQIACRMEPKAPARPPPTPAAARPRKERRNAATP